MVRGWWVGVGCGVLGWGHHFRGRYDYVFEISIRDPRFRDPRFRDPRFRDPRFRDPRFRDPRI